MSRLDDLPPDQKAALALLLRRGQSYADLASVLDISERAVHDRAHAGLAMLAPAQARALSVEQREQVGDLLLGQAHSDDQRAAAVRSLEASPDARAWAQALVSELAPIGDGALPDLPPEQISSAPVGAAAPAALERPDGMPAPVAAAPATPTASDSAPARAAARPALPVSRTAGAILLAVLVAGVVLAAVLIPSGGGSSKPSAASSKASASRGQSALAGGVAPKAKRINLNPVEAGSKSIGVALVLSEGGKYAFYLAAEHMASTSGFFYAVWLYNSPTSAEALGKSPAVGSDGRLQGGALLPADAANYGRIVVTRETNVHPTRPGPIVLSGAFALR